MVLELEECESHIDRRLLVLRVWRQGSGHWASMSFKEASRFGKRGTLLAPKKKITTSKRMYRKSLPDLQKVVVGFLGAKIFPPGNVSVEGAAASIFSVKHGTIR